MNIKPIVYESLTPQQRIIATIEALAKGDAHCAERLVDTCPKKTYRQQETAYSLLLGALMELGVIVECDVRGETINLLLNCMTDKDDEAATDSVQSIVDMRTAWSELLESRGINPDSMEKVAVPAHYTARVVRKFEETVTPTREGIEEYRAILEAYLDKVAGG